MAASADRNVILKHYLTKFLSVKGLFYMFLVRYASLNTHTVEANTMKTHTHTHRGLCMLQNTLIKVLSGESQMLLEH